jgi:UDP-N-acetylglucosamine 2-epimerase (non-hydrolysing)
MIDTLLKHLLRLKEPKLYQQNYLSKNNYFILTLHRPSNVDDENNLYDLLNSITSNSHGLPIVFPVHPRTRKRLDILGKSFSKLIITDPMGYLEFNYLVNNAKAVITDSGGITEETTVLGIPCMTLRDSTERPETCSIGTNELLGTNPNAIKPALEKLFNGNWKKGGIPDLWDGNTSERIVNHLIDIFQV